jgi:hypothetical protein
VCQKAHQSLWYSTLLRRQNEPTSEPHHITYW